MTGRYLLGSCIMIRDHISILLIFFSLVNAACSPKIQTEPTAVHPAFTVLNDQINDDLEEFEITMRYFSEDNFVGRPIPGYNANKAYLTIETKRALLNAHEEFMRLGYRVKIFDAYRPQMAVDYFSFWAADLNDTVNKSQYYPNVNKSELFAKGYIAEKSGHSRGSAVDITLINTKTGDEVDMGSQWDFFDPISSIHSSQVTDQQLANRKLLANVMSKHGFKALDEEWWHFSLISDPFPNTYFNFPIN